MSKAICCDRCGMFRKLIVPYIESEKDLRWKLLQSGGPTVSDPIGLESTETLLCPSCAVEFSGFMKTRSKNITVEFLKSLDGSTWEELAAKINEYRDNITQCE